MARGAVLLALTTKGAVHGRASARDSCRSPSEDGTEARHKDEGSRSSMCLNCGHNTMDHSRTYPRGDMRVGFCMKRCGCPKFNDGSDPIQRAPFKRKRP